MNYFYKETEDIMERFELVTERIDEIPSESELPDKLQAYFNTVAAFTQDVRVVLQKAIAEELMERSLQECEADAKRIFERFMPSNYEESFLNPAYAVSQLGQELGGLLSTLYYQMSVIIRDSFAGRLDSYTAWCELFVQIYGICCMEEEDKYRAEAVQEAIYSYRFDNAATDTYESISAMILPEIDTYTSIIMKSDLMDDRYMYSTGLYVGDNELKIAAHLRTLPQESIDAMARTFVEGYIKGFETTGKDISIKDTVQLHVPLGFDLITRSAIRQFNEAGLSCTLRIGKSGRDYYSSAFNKQMDYDHKEDKAFFFDKAMADHDLECIKNAFEKHKEKAAVYGGPAVIETFGDVPFEPKNKAENPKLSDKQNKLNVYFMSSQGQIINDYIHGDERSFTIIAYPIPEIGEDFKEIFDETVVVNTLDYELYKNIQQYIIDALDQGEAVHVTGRGDNHTDITVKLQELTDPATQTIFENCVADVNIPVGEVFTSPKLEGTKGVLHVTKVYLNELCYRNLELTFEDGKITEYTCSNFEAEEENKKLIKDNVLFKHDTLPLGEFAIGTNTTAYRMGQRFGIADKLPILIAEKTGPHFAVGDTCYSHAEDVVMRNPDGKECIARDNSFSLLRKEGKFEEAYFNCHTDITIPYDELGDITVLKADGTTISIIEKGRFVLPGTEELNKALI